MNKKLLALTLLIGTATLLLYYYSILLHRKPANSSTTSTNDAAFSHIFKVKENFPQYIVKLNGLYHIVLKDQINNTPIQTLALPYSYDTSIENEETIIQSKDYNFDEYLDLAILAQSGSGQKLFHIYLYSPQKKRFVYNKTLSELATPLPNYDNKTIESLSSTMGGFLYIKKIYSYTSTQNLTLIAIEEQNYKLLDEKETFVRTYSTINENKSVNVECEIEIQPLTDSKVQKKLLNGEWSLCSKDPYFFPVEDVIELKN